MGTQLSFAQSKPVEETLKKIAQDKWNWMADKSVEPLADLFDEQSVFVHMGGSWGKKQEIDVIKSGAIWYKKADVHEVTVEVIDNTAILLSRIDLLAVVGGNKVTNPFIVTEVYILRQGKWKLGSLSFTKVLSPGRN